MLLAFLIELIYSCNNTFSHPLVVSKRSVTHSTLNTNKLHCISERSWERDIIGDRKDLFQRIPKVTKKKRTKNFIYINVLTTNAWPATAAKAEPLRSNFAQALLLLTAC